VDLAASAKCIVGCDIRKDFLQLARIRNQLPNIDVFNLMLCNQLSALCDAKQKPATRILTTCFQGLATAKHFPSFLAILAALMDRILNHHAVPDWYLPTKFFLAGKGGVRGCPAASAI